MRKDWIKLPMWIFTELGLSPTEACILALIIDRAKLSKKWECILSHDDIASQLNISRRTVIRALDELEAKELISIQRTGKQSIYTVSEQARIEQAVPPSRRADDDYSKRIKMLSAQAQAREDREREEKIKELAALANNI